MYESVLGLKKPIFGLDIGFHTLKVIQLKGEGAGSKLFGVSEVPIEPKTLSKEGIRDKKKIAEAILSALKIAKPHPINARIVSSALPESLVFTKSIGIPSMTPQEINKNIPYQASEFFPIPPQEMYIDWQIVGRLPGQNLVDVLVVAAPKKIVDSLAETIQMAGLELSNLETKPVAVVRALIPTFDQGPYLLVDIGAKTSGIICYDQGTIKMTSTISIGGDDLGKELEPNLKGLNSEILHLIKYYQNRIGQATIFKKIILAGGGANIPELVNLIEKQTKIKTEIGWPQIQIKTYNSKFAAAIGLAMKKI
ncbi:MAG: pilus assembly protein PilM [Patescibacteria group bacterium]